MGAVAAPFVLLAEAAGVMEVIVEAAGVVGDVDGVEIVALDADGSDSERIGDTGRAELRPVEEVPLPISDKSRAPESALPVSTSFPDAFFVTA